MAVVGIPAIIAELLKQHMVLVRSLYPFHDYLVFRDR